MCGGWLRSLSSSVWRYDLTERDVQLRLAELEDLRAIATESFGFDRSMRPAQVSKRLLALGNALAWLKEHRATVAFSDSTVAVWVDRDRYAEQSSLVDSVEVLAQEEGPW